MASGSYLTLDGPSALTGFQSKRIADRMNADNADISTIRARYVHYVCLIGNTTLDSKEHSLLKNLLAYGEYIPDSQEVEAGCTRHVLYKYPRLGTVSPWSSQATGISYVCGLGKKIKRIERGVVYTIDAKGAEFLDKASQSHDLYDRMTQILTSEAPPLKEMFAQHTPQLLQIVDTQGQDVNAKERIAAANTQLGLGLEEQDIEYLADAFGEGGIIGRNPTDVELYMFAQVHSEHCRHRFFNSELVIDGKLQPQSLFDLIRDTHRKSPKYTVSAYKDNAAVFEGHKSAHWAPNRAGEWTSTPEDVYFLLKAETHNHPTQISPFPGAATGAGGELRDEGAVGRGSTPGAGFTGFCTSDLLIPDHRQPWELDIGKPAHTASALDIMIEGPIGAANYNNEFGRACLAGFFRTLSIPLPSEGNEVRGYHKPLMLAGGVGRVRPQLAVKRPEEVPAGSYTVVIGGPAMLIGLGGGAASSKTSSEGSVELDYGSVQRGNAEVQNRCHALLQACNALGSNSPIAFVHDVGAGGLSNALPELVEDIHQGAVMELREVASADPSLSPLQIWCCEAQERYVAAIPPERLNEFKKLADRERCGYSIVGYTTGRDGTPTENAGRQFVLKDRDAEGPYPIDLPMDFLFSKRPLEKKILTTRKLKLPKMDPSLGRYLKGYSNSEVIEEAVHRTLNMPAVGGKGWLVHIGDRSVGGLAARDPCVGAWQVPVADCAVAATSLTRHHFHGESHAIGERPLIALISPAASARMALAESLLNLAASDVEGRLERVRLSCNWQAARNVPGEGAALYEAVSAVSDLCIKSGISIPVGKDSLSMKTSWSGENGPREVVSPMTLVCNAFAPVSDIRRTFTPALRRFEDVGESLIVYVDLAAGNKALGGSCLAQSFGEVDDTCPDLRDDQLLKDFMDAMEQLHESGVVLAYHDISDGGLLTSLVEMMFAGRCGLEVNLDSLSKSNDIKHIIEALFSEELGAVFQIRKSQWTNFNRCFATCGPPVGLITAIGRVPRSSKQELVILRGTNTLYRRSRASLQQKWASTSYHIQRLRDNPDCAESEYQSITDDSDPGLSYQLSFDPQEQLRSNTISSLMSSFSLTNKPRVAVLREEGTNGASEMAFAFHTAGFIAVDVHMTDILSGQVALDTFKVIAACGGFSFGDVLSAGRGWAQSVLNSERARRQFEAFLKRPDSLMLGVCNGAQFFTHIAEIIPGAERWPTFTSNVSRQFEARFSMVKVTAPSKGSAWFHGMHGSALPIVSSHGEGYASFRNAHHAEQLLANGEICLQYVDNHRLQPTETFPFNPNGSPRGITGLSAAQGRVIAMMPHPERNILGGVASFIPPGKAEEWGDLGPWSRIFASARRWVG